MEDWTCWAILLWYDVEKMAAAKSWDDFLILIQSKLYLFMAVISLLDHSSKFKSSLSLDTKCRLPSCYTSYAITHSVPEKVLFSYIRTISNVFWRAPCLLNRTKTSSSREVCFGSFIRAQPFSTHTSRRDTILYGSNTYLSPLFLEKEFRQV